MREIVLDTETTGLDPLKGDRIVEIAAIELVNHMPTGVEYHCWLDPERDMPEEAFRVHGLSTEFLTGKPKFAEEVHRFLDFIGDAPLVIHNAAFDANFINAELARTKRIGIPAARLIDTLEIARRKFPAAPNSLDALCRRFGVDLSVRTKHGALIDCRLLAEVYLELIGGRQPGLALAVEVATVAAAAASRERIRTPRPPRRHAPSAAEIAAHEAFVATLSNPIWDQ